jgi:dynein light chain LC8-type
MAEEEEAKEQVNMNFVYSEMSQADQAATVELCMEVLKQDHKNDDATMYQKDVAKSIKTQLDSSRGGTWNVIVGQSFGSFVSHESKTVTHFFIGNIGFLIWRHG